MRRGVLSILVLVGAGLAGCVDDGPQTLPLDQIFGTNGVVHQNGTTFIMVASLEGRVLANATDAPWTLEPRHTLEPAKVVLQKPDPGPAGGGGVTKELALPPVDLRLEVRFLNASQLSGYSIRWAHISGDLKTIDWSPVAPADEAHALVLDAPGVRFVAGELLKRGASVAIVAVPLEVAVDVHWVVESSVHPIKAGGTPVAAPPPSNYEEMADKFPFEVHGPLLLLVAQTAYRGSYSPGSGSDVDLEVDQPGGDPAGCTGAGGSNDPAPNPAQAEEKLEIKELAEGSWTARVGSLRIHPDCSSNPYYYNASTVPYTLELFLHYGG